MKKPPCTKRIANAALMLLCLSAVGCTTTFKHDLHFNPAEPIRVAIVPFVSVDAAGTIVDEDPNLLIDDVALISSRNPLMPSDFVQRIVRNELKEKSALDLVSPAVTYGELLHHGFADPNLTLDRRKLFAASPTEICVHHLSCDAVLYGRITRWDRSYFGIESVTTVGIDLELRSAKDGAVLFKSTAIDSDSRGLTKGPTGFSDLVLEPLKGLDSKLVTELARRIVDKAVEPLQVNSRPEFLESAPPAIFSSAHDAFSSHLAANSHLTVVLAGTEHQNAAFSIGQTIKSIPMTEREPGQYIGEYHPLPTDSFTEAPVIVELSDSYGRMTRQKVGGSSLTLAAK